MELKKQFTSAAVCLAAANWQIDNKIAIGFSVWMEILKINQQNDWNNPVAS